MEFLSTIDGTLVPPRGSCFVLQCNMRPHVP
jgi:hypothetical protein